MKDRLAAPGVGSVAALLAILAMGVGGAVAAPATKPSVRIGVYDSRGVAIAYARSAGFRESMTRLRGDFEQAKARGDSAQMKTLEQQGQWMQVRLHQRGFSTAGAGDLLARVADGLAGVAREAGVVLIVSKWEMPLQGSGRRDRGRDPADRQAVPAGRADAASPRRDSEATAGPVRRAVAGPE
jgi:hypothetical protein